MNIAEPMGACNSGPHFQRCMQEILRELLYPGLLQYLDDSLLYAKDEMNCWRDLIDILLIATTWYKIASEQNGFLCN